jgi:hypothetical protein
MITPILFLSIVMVDLLEALEMKEDYKFNIKQADT